MAQLLDLNSIRSVLVRLEDTIIFSLIERAQFSCNARTYQPCAFSNELPGWQGSWLDWILLGTEEFQAKARRYQSPDEYPFSNPSDLPDPVLPPLEYEPVLHEPAVTNVNDKIMQFYTQEIVPSITKPGDDLNYGSTATRDVETLQAVSRRVHYGMLVSESKYRADVDTFNTAIKANDVKTLESLITKPQVEAALLKRLERKARHYGQDESQGGSMHDMKVDPEVVVRMYKDHVIPLTKVVEVEPDLLADQLQSFVGLEIVVNGRAYTDPATKTQDAEKEKARKQLEKEKEKAKKAKDAVKTKLSPPKQAPTAWQLFFIEELDKARQQGKIEIGVISHSASELYKKLTDAEKMPYVEHSKELRAKQAKEFAEYIKSLPYDVLKKENSLRTKLRKQGKKGVQKIRDPNAPKRPLTAYFAYLKDLRDKEDFRQSIFGNDATGWLQSSIIDQSRAASDKWKALSEDVKQTYKDKATEAKKKYEDAKIEYQNSFL
ncbi:hypothetical protein E3P86_00664 [Wallemia ichthyophaga]|uniref:Chorismate mutase n=1 Tax=Wallemia ichthyophaga TaxID=245174 RepID=A0A4T0JCN3_WALIC|nr:hypothetical protein E3P86_00664 [Wallemia ichthyophaga]